MLIPKHNTYRKQKWLVNVRAIKECVICSSIDDIEAAHRNKNKGFGMKTDDCLTACLCQRCHFTIDNGYAMSLEERREMMDLAILSTYRKLSHLGLISVDSSIYIPESKDECEPSLSDVVEGLCLFVKEGKIKPI